MKLTIKTLQVRKLPLFQSGTTKSKWTYEKILKMKKPESKLKLLPTLKNRKSSLPKLKLKTTKGTGLNATSKQRILGKFRIAMMKATA